MHRESEHIASEELLLFIDGELQEQRKSAVRQHLEACWGCRTRMANAQNTIAEFVNAHHKRWERAFPSVDGPRALLRARLMAMRTDISAVTRRVPLRSALLSFSAALALTLLLIWFPRTGRISGVRDEPLINLTPGESVPATQEEVCSAGFSRKERTDLPPSLKQSVFDRYGLRGVRDVDFEVDFLITPELGGVASLRNLWPEPYGQTQWNARVKDQLEDRLRSLVCSHQLSLSAAQNDLASDWIHAYRKYFGTDHPLPSPRPATLILALFKAPGT